MPREIKFRAWDKEERCLIPPAEIAITAEGTIYTWDRIDEEWQAEAIPIEVYEYTGLHDKNGKEIYEGDIVKFSYISPLDQKEKSYIWVVRYGNGMYWLRHIKHYYDSTLYLKFTQIEVVGNIYENPEFLAGEVNHV